MSQTETLSLIHEIESLVSDQLQVVSYKWLSRSYMVSSDEAKRLLHEFVQKHEGGLEVVYALSGWLKSTHPSYHIRLVAQPKLAEAQQEFDGHCSVQVYSVQASIPKDPAVLWNAEFIQAEELFKQPPSVDNCLRDNRFCGISSSFVRRNVDGQPAVSATKNTAPISIAKVDHTSQNVVKNVKSEINGTGNKGVHDNISKPIAEKQKSLPVPTGKKKGQADKNSSATGGSLASFWGRPSTKPKPCSVPAENSNLISNPAEATENAQTCAHETVDCDSDDDDNQGVILRRPSNRKRRVVFDLSDEDEDIISLASPDVPSKQPPQDSRQNDKKSLEKTTLNFDLQVEHKPLVKEEKATEKKVFQPPREDLSIMSKCTSNGKSSTEKLQSSAPEISVNKDSVKKAAPGSPKRRKVMKTRIDEKGREVTEVVWEGEETEPKKADADAAKKADAGAAKKADNKASTNAINSAPATKKPPATSNATGKGGSKKAGNAKDPKQGNILSFFKKV
ncbi:uncharacterized protein LOC131647995 [Vicia villosa]|uniref:uncharacterized protein LOC131647995 n=1 Tax=Vicia villosa TaxID=3911 RepID=UPI00273B81B2|nr:uncharacterized protein LOC131647995 [Vicia villosa]